MERNRKILITNDDGIDSDGLRRLVKEAVKFGEVWVVAPDGQRSAVSHSITLHKHLDVYPYDFGIEGVHAFSCTGMPADCVRVGSISVMPYKPDVVITGINDGYNAATDIQYSATVGGAMEAAFQGYPAIAFSEGRERHEVTDRCLHDVLEELIDQIPGEGKVINVNFPECTWEQYRGILRDRKASKGVFFLDSYPLLEELSNGGKRYMVHGERQYEADEGTDLRALYDGYISIGLISNLC